METMKDPSPSSLTARERQIVTLLLEGCTNKTIAARLGISDQTVMNQLSTLYQKVGVGSRLRGYRIVQEIGLTEFTNDDAGSCGNVRGKQAMTGR